MGVIGTGLLLLLFCLQCAQCWRDEIQSRSVCNKLHVSHSSSSREINSSNIIVAMMRGSKRVNCIKPLTKYNCKFPSAFACIDFFCIYEQFRASMVIIMCLKLVNIGSV